MVKRIWFINDLEENSVVPHNICIFQITMRERTTKWFVSLISEEADNPDQDPSDFYHHVHFTRLHRVCHNSSCDFPIHRRVGDAGFSVLCSDHPHNCRVRGLCCRYWNGLVPYTKPSNKYWDRYRNTNCETPVLNTPSQTTGLFNSDGQHRFFINVSGHTLFAVL